MLEKLKTHGIKYHSIVSTVQVSSAQLESSTEVAKHFATASYFLGADFAKDQFDAHFSKS